VYRDTILETPTYVQNRYFENLSMYSIFSSFESKWIRAPHTKITESTFDLEDWKVKRDFSNFDKTKYVMAIDGAQFLRIGSDVIVNISSYNHYLALEWLKPLFPDTTFHIVELTDNHIDGTLMALKPGVFLVNTGTDFDTLNLDSLRQRLPLKFRDWELIHPKNLNKPSPDFEMQLASSRGMDINVLSLDEKRVLVNKDAKGVAEALDRANFEVISVSLDNCEVFGGGIHCSTLDLVREDEFKEYV
jgi:glycine amidinotransferase